ncbi:hypothetical protein GCM10027271_26910 [Saccharopolyspora gloriosae]|uniref:ABC-2 type transport system permease protein n=1 Tax=Saccharopolyspora gloriosae TaxID=455344 RepID=A0A840NHW3_9PSEU|nr:ABC transporter permease [Saccharopolyspora gloriosae]MBB5071470.1 ABC-2 type transport system permease protein [Saccharopolyspora gloriosae]
MRGIKPTIGLALSELALLVRQRTMVALVLLLPAVLVFMAGVVEKPQTPEAWAAIAARNCVAILCITVYFISTSTLTARRQTLALKRFRTSGIPDAGLLIGLLSPAVVAGLVQSLIYFGGILAMGAPMPRQPGVLVVALVSGIVVATVAGTVTSAVTATPERAQFTMMPLLGVALGGAALITAVNDPLLGRIALVGPLVSNVDMIFKAWGGPQLGVQLPAGTWFAIGAGAVLIWLVIFSYAARRFFRWDARK